jgi:hypothetical protein
MLNHFGQRPANPIEHPDERRSPLPAQSRGLKFRHLAQALGLQLQRLNLVEVPVPGDFAIEYRLLHQELILQCLPLKQSTLTDGADRDCRRPGKTQAASSAQPARADPAVAEAMHTAAVELTYVAGAPQFRDVGHRPAASRTPRRGSFGGKLKRASPIIGQALGLHGERPTGRIANEISLQHPSHAACSSLSR